MDEHLTPSYEYLAFSRWEASNGTDWNAGHVVAKAAGITYRRLRYLYTRCDWAFWSGEIEARILNAIA